MKHVPAELAVRVAVDALELKVQEVAVPPDSIMYETFPPPEPPDVLAFKA
jgi:ferredoxin-NADP reductase